MRKRDQQNSLVLRNAWSMARWGSHRGRWDSGDPLNRIVDDSAVFIVDDSGNFILAE